MPVSLTVDQEVSVSLAVTDRVGNPATIDGSPVWASSDESVATVVENAGNPLAAIILSADRAGAALITATVDADLGEGVRQIVGTLEVQVTAGEAQFVTLEAGAPSDKPVA